jgi:thiol-disulfide isomerase/thioredoxin
MQRRPLLAALGALGLPCVHAVPSAAIPLGYDVQPWPRGRKAPPIPSVDTAGRAWALSSLRSRVVLINFWASWCAPCRSEMPALQALAERENSGLTLLTINLKESPAAIAQFVLGTGLSLPVLRDPQGDVARAWGVRVYPSTVVMDPEGRPRSLVRGSLDWSAPEGDALWKPLLPLGPQALHKR